MTEKVFFILNTRDLSVKRKKTYEPHILARPPRLYQGSVLPSCTMPQQPILYLSIKSLEQIICPTNRSNNVVHNLNRKTVSLIYWWKQLKLKEHKIFKYCVNRDESI